MTRRVAWAALADVAAVVVFVGLGRRSHGEDLAGTAEVAAPFLIALLAGWFLARAWRDPLALRTGLAVWAVTAVGGLALRGAVFDRGLATSFMIVALVTLLALIAGWRGAAMAFRRRGAVV